MRPRVRRREQATIGFITLFFVLGLIAVNTVWPKGFPVIVAIGGTVGALLVLYEVRLTKQLAQAEFVRDLQNSFVSDQNIDALWRKLLNREATSFDDRVNMSSYLTFFETVYLLQSQGSIGFRLVDDLFRNRFFTAVGDAGIQQHALLSSPSAFRNIHFLIEDWHGYLVHHNKPIHAGYYSYVRALTAVKGYEVRELDEQHVSAVMALQASGAVAPKSALSEEQVSRALAQNNDIVLGAFREDRLVGVVVVTAGGSADESRARLALVVTDPAARRQGLARALAELAEPYAAGLGERAITAPATNEKGFVKLLSRAGYRRATPTGPFLRELNTPDSRWTR